MTAIPTRRRTLSSLVVAGAVALGGLLLPATAPAVAAVDVPAPVLHYPLATDLREAGGAAGRAATAVGAVTFEQGLTLPGGANSSSGYVRLPDDALSGLGDDLTVSVWVRSDTPARNGAALSFGTPPVNGLPTHYWLVNPTGPAGTARSVMTNATNPTAPWSTEVQVAGPNTASRRGSWVNYTTVFTAGSLTSYVDGVRVGSVAKARTFSQFAAAGPLQGYLGRSGYAGDPAFRGSFRDLRVFGSALGDEQVAALDAQDGFVLDDAAARLSLGDTTAVTGDLSLPATAGDDVTVSWSTSDAAVVSATGEVTLAATARSADLTATLTRSGTTRTRVFRITVPSREQVATAAAEVLVVPATMASGDTLPGVDVDGVTTTWSTTTPGLTVTGGVLSAATPTTGTLTATLSGAGLTPRTLTAEVRVLPAADARYLLGYTRTPLADAQVYGGNVSRSLHLALGASRTGVGALNENYGVLFASAQPTGLELTEVRTLVDPHLFETPTGYGVVATRATGDGTPDATAATSLLLFTSPDLLDWTEVGPVAVDASGAGVRRPQAQWDAARNRYVVGWRTASGTDRVTTTTDLARPTAYAAVRSGRLPSTAQATTTATGAVPGNTLVVDTRTERALRTRYGRVANTGVSVAPVTSPAGVAPDLSAVRAELSYDDGSTATRAVDWDADDVAAIDRATPGTYPVDGTVRQGAQPFPYLAGRADPAVIRWQGRYLFLATDRAEHRFDLRSADTLAGLRSAPDHLILTPRAGLPGPLWAPEFHVIGGELYVLFAAGVDRDSWNAVQAHVMKLRTGGDPTRAADWETPRLVEKRQGGRLQLDAEHPGISLDMTYFEDGDTSYVAWSQRYTSPVLGDAQLWIATVDRDDPARLTSDPVRFGTSVFGWDRNTSPVMEGPFVIRRGGRLLMTYSGSNIDNTYAVGLLSATAGADLLDPAAWTKAPTPLLKTDVALGQYGPGHSMFTVDDDGNDVLVYHARNGLGGSRDAAVRRVHWAADGMPILDMTADEEVAPAYRRVRTTVTVAAAPVDPPTTPTPPVAAAPPVPAPPVVAPAAPGATPATASVRVRGTARAGRTSTLVVRVPGGGRVSVSVGGKKQVVRSRQGRAVVTVRFTRPGQQKVVVTSAAGRSVTTVRVRR